MRYHKGGTTHHPVRKGILGISMLIVLLASFATGSLPIAHAQDAEVIGTSFNSNFNSNHNGWTPVTGSWALAGSAYYTSPGVAGHLSTIKHVGTYSRLVYTVRMKRTGSSADDGNQIKIRGNPNNLDSVNDWKNSYGFHYTNSGYYSVSRYFNGNYTRLKYWTRTSAVRRGGWNTLKVVAIGTSMKFYINGTLVWHGSDSHLSSGAVGVGVFRSTGTTGNRLYIDWATLSTTATSGLGLASDVEPGVEAPGGSLLQSP